MLPNPMSTLLSSTPLSSQHHSPWLKLPLIFKHSFCLKSITHLPGTFLKSLVYYSLVYLQVFHSKKSKLVFFRLSSEPTSLSSLYISYLGDLIQLYNFKCYLYGDGSQICISDLEYFPSSDYLLNISMQISYRQASEA